MRSVLKIVFIIEFFALVFVMNTMASNRIALVIGNSDYATSGLKNPDNDATDMAGLLKQCGFDVILKINATHRDMERSIRDFGKKLKKSEVGLFYYAGHGIQVQGRNYLIPIGSEIESQGDVKFEALDAGFVLAKMEDAGNDLNIVILDACRNNPFSRNFRSTQQGLARMDAPKGTLIAYATAPGSLSADGEGRNGIYTKHLIQNIQRPELTIEQVFKKVRIAVVSETVNKQVPWESSSLMGRFYFNPQPAGQDHLKQTVEAKQPPDNSYELLFWESIRDSNDSKMFEAYLERFPNGVFSKLSKINIQKYRANPNLKQQISLLKKGPQEQPFKSASINSADNESNIIARDGHYVKYKNGIVFDKNTGLEWIAGPEMLGWYKTRSWASGLAASGGGWRMPTLKELKTLYKSGVGTRNMTPLLETSAWYIWYANSSVQAFRFGEGSGTSPYSDFSTGGALAVRLRK